MSSPEPDPSDLQWLMRHSVGSPAISVAIIDGPVSGELIALHPEGVTLLGARSSHTCSDHLDSACSHGTFIASVLMAPRESAAPGMCPGCSFVSRPIFVQDSAEPSAPPHDVATAITECVDAGVRVINISASIRRCDGRDERLLTGALDRAAHAGAVVVAAAGNEGSVTSSPLTRHPAVLPVSARSSNGLALSSSNSGRTTGLRGVGVPAENVLGMRPDGGLRRASGTSVAAARASGAVALLWSIFGAASAGDIRGALIGTGSRRSTIPPLLDARTVHGSLQRSHVHA